MTEANAPAATARWRFGDPQSFLAKLRALRAAGIPPERLRVLMPYPVPEAERLLALKPSRLRFFTLAGAVAGAVLGFAFPILTVRDWPLITGGKPLISIPPFVIIAFALTILLGALASLVGFLHLTRLPTPRALRDPEEHENYFVIRILGGTPAPEGTVQPHAASPPAGAPPDGREQP